MFRGQKSERADLIWNWYEQRIDQKLVSRPFDEFIECVIYRDKKIWLIIRSLDEFVELFVNESDIRGNYTFRKQTFEETKDCIDFLDSLIILKDMNID